ncbi:MAG: hypothetical protein JXJ22_08300 [Bacteroidales bacterium]|nr:hypothetical protein [Bacteroidales bacterium]
MMKKHIILILLLGVFFLSKNIGQSNDKAEYLSDFQSNNWPLVIKAKENIENLNKELISDLIKLLDKNTIKKLKNTDDLIYPGAEKFFGHGQIIDYNIDNISVRAGWLLEDLTFQNFGFTGIHLQEDGLIDYIKITFPAYYNNSVNRKKINNSSTENLREIIRNLSVQNAKIWYAENIGIWNRLDALVDALNSYDEKRQVKALFYLRNGKTKCQGLNQESYSNLLANPIQKLSNSEIKRVSENAKLILVDDKLDWLKIKPQ